MDIVGCMETAILCGTDSLEQDVVENVSKYFLMPSQPHRSQQGKDVLGGIRLSEYVK